MDFFLSVYLNQNIFNQIILDTENPHPHKSPYQMAGLVSQWIKVENQQYNSIPKMSDQFYSMQLLLTIQMNNA